MSRWNPLTPKEREAARKARQARYLEKNRDKRRASWRRYRKKKRAEKALAEGRPIGKIGRFARQTPEEKIAKQRAHSVDYWIRNPEKRKTLSRLYYQSNKESVLQNSRNRRARKRAAEGKHTAAEIRELFKRQKGRCAYCLKTLAGRTFHIDHHVPLSRGGSNDINNLRLLHPKCNLVKGAKDPIEYALSQGMLCW